MRVFLLLALMTIVSIASAAELADLDWLEGEWRGYSIMGDRSNVNHKTFRFEQAGRYLVERTLAMFPPAEPSTEYETHQDMVVYYAIGGELRAKGFFVEGFVQSSTVTADAARVVIESLEVEGGPPGMRARMTYARVEGDADRFTGLFEVDWGSGEMSTLSTYEFERID